MSLLGLSNELLQAIAVYCGVEGGGLLRTNKRLYENAEDILWQSAIKDPDTFTKIISGAAESGNLEMMKKAASYEADFDLIHPVSCPQNLTKLKSVTNDSFWASPLHLAVYHNHYDTVKWLITVQGVDVDAPGRLICDCTGMTERNAYFFTGLGFHDHAVWTALHFAICQQHDSIARLLLSRNATTSVMLDSSVMRDSKVISRCVEALRNGNTRDISTWPETMTALHVAALRGTKSMVTHLVQARGMDINELDRYMIDKQPLHYAVLSQDEKMIEHVVSLGADVDGTATMGWVFAGETPISFALLHKELKAVFKLLDAGAKTWLDDGQERKAFLSDCSVLSSIDRLGSPEKVMTVMVKLVDKTLQDYASDGTRCLPIEGEIREALEILSRVAPKDWNLSNAFSKTAKTLLRNVFASMTNGNSSHNLANHYHGTALARFAKKVSDWEYSLSSARRRKRTLSGGYQRQSSRQGQK